MNERELKIGESLTKLMKKQGLTLKDIVEGTKVPLSTLSEWKKNSRNPNVIQVSKVAEFLGVSVHFLLFGQEDQHEPLQQVLKSEIFTGAFEITLRKIKMPNE